MSNVKVEIKLDSQELAKNAAHAAKVAAVAVKVADKTNATVARLGESRAEIGKVIAAEPDRAVPVRRRNRPRTPARCSPQRTTEEFNSVLRVTLRVRAAGDRSQRKQTR